MKKKYLYTTILVGSFMLAGIQPVLATKYIPSDTSIGTWDPGTRTYTLTTDVFDNIQINYERIIEINEDNLTLDGAGHTLTGPATEAIRSYGVYLNGRTGVTVKNVSVEGCNWGILLENCSGCTLTNNTANSNDYYGIELSGSSGNILANNTANFCKFWVEELGGHMPGWGIYVSGGTNNTLTGNTVSDNCIGIQLSGSSGNSLTDNSISGPDQWCGITLGGSNGNTLRGNTITSHWDSGILVAASSNNQIYNNNLINNGGGPLLQVYVYGGSSGNVFNLDKPIGGNFWSDWTSPDNDGDGFVDEPYCIFDYSYVCAAMDYLPFAQQDGWLNQPPVANAGPDQTVECACQTPGGTKVTLDGSGDPDGDPLTYKWTGPFAESPASGPTPTVTLDGCVGDYEITLVVNDGELDSEPDTVVITVVDTTPPTIICPDPITVEAQSPSGVPATDPDILTFLTAVSASDNCDPSPEITDDAPVEFPLGDTIVTFSTTDAQNNTSSCQGTVTVHDTTPPAITIIAPEPYGLYPVGDLVLDFSASDLVSGNIEPPDFLWGTLADAACYSETVYPGEIPGAGVYTLVVSAKDEAGNEAESEPRLFVVYDASGGFVTGGGWIDSPAGAYKPDPSLEGKANFGFISKYKKGTTEPTGQTEFVFHAGDLNFHSSSYDWLVVTGSDYAMFKGWGSINGYGDYHFMLWAGDGAPDTFRIRIWWEDGEIENVVYDNGMNQPIEGGSIVVHAK